MRSPSIFRCLASFIEHDTGEAFFNSFHSQAKPGQIIFLEICLFGVDFFPMCLFTEVDPGFIWESPFHSLFPGDPMTCLFPEKKITVKAKGLDLCHWQLSPMEALT